MKKVIIAGGRDFNNYDFLFEKCDQVTMFYDGDEVEIVSGTAKGADELGEKFSRDVDFNLKRFPANWNKYGKSAGMIRNEEMADYSDILIAFWDGKSTGTKGMIQIALSYGLEVHVFRY